MQLLEDQQVPLLVVLLFAGLLDPVVDPPGQPVWLCMWVMAM